MVVLNLILPNPLQMHFSFQDLLEFIATIEALEALEADIRKIFSKIFSIEVATSGQTCQD